MSETEKVIQKFKNPSNYEIIGEFKGGYIVIDESDCCLSEYSKEKGWHSVEDKYTPSEISSIKARLTRLKL